jgi:hypothetical protein
MTDEWLKLIEVTENEMHLISYLYVIKTLSGHLILMENLDQSSETWIK